MRLAHVLRARSRPPPFHSAGKHTSALSAVHRPSPIAEDQEKSPQYDLEALKRQRRTDWKRRQGGQTFLDHVVIHVRGGRGGDGCVAFNREKFKPYGPPSGGNGGRGADVYISPTSHLTTLSSVPFRVRGQSGGTGQGTWQNGKNAQPTIIKVPLGTIVRQLSPDDSRKARNEHEAEEEALQGLSLEERRQKLRQRRWVHYPNYEEDNLQRDAFKDAERVVYREERERRLMRKRRLENPIYLDLNKEEEEEKDPNAPLGLPRTQYMGHLLASGGAGGYGNPHFLSPDNRSPKFATRGEDGERLSFSLELKLLADIGLVGMPNAGKSTLLRALTAGRAKTEVAGYAFTTLNPVVAVVRVADDGSFEGWEENLVYDETWVEEERERELMESGAYANALTRNQRAAVEAELKDEQDESLESFRFTVADNPGLISQASNNVGLGHSFLRSIERSLALVYVVDLSSPAPWDDLRVLKDELEKYKPGMVSKVRMVLANKADLLGGDGADPEAVREAKEKLRKLEDFVAHEMVVQTPDAAGNSQSQRTLDVVPISAKYSLNMRKVVGMMRGYVEEARGGQDLEVVSGPTISGSQTRVS